MEVATFFQKRMIALLAVLIFGARITTVFAEDLAKEIAARRTRVPEFNEIKRLAERHGLRVWLFGGTAAAYGHYVFEDLDREKGPGRYQSARYDYDFTNIYRSTQDVDLVADGPANKIAAFQQELRTQFPYFVGSKDQWEVRSLKEKIGDKLPLLNSPDFLNQHSDSNSTGMIELTSSTEPIVRDLRDWNSTRSQFLRDIEERKIHYYFSELHQTTERYRDGKNPSIISVVRYLTKIFQFDLTARNEDMQRIQKIIDEFDPKSIPRGGYLSGWLEKNGPKLMKHATNVEQAWELLEKTGLRKKLIDTSDSSRIDSLAWWMNKSPLRNLTVGLGSGRSIADIAKEKGIPIQEFVVSHETNSFLAYESLTRNNSGKPNVFISRNGALGEAAIHGDGHYTLIGRKGARGTGLTVRYLPNPNAREGHDFVVHENMIIWRNKAALTTIHENITITPKDYFEKLATGNSLFTDADRGIEEKVSRKVANNLARLQPHEMGELKEIVLNALKSRNPPQQLIRAWLQLSTGLNDPELRSAIAKRIGSAKEIDPTPILRPMAQARFATDPDLRDAWFDQLLDFYLGFSSPAIASNKFRETGIGIFSMVKLSERRLSTETDSLKKASLIHILVNLSHPPENWLNPYLMGLKLLDHEENYLSENILKSVDTTIPENAEALIRYATEKRFWYGETLKSKLEKISPETLRPVIQKMLTENPILFLEFDYRRNTFPHFHIIYEVAEALNKETGIIEKALLKYLEEGRKVGFQRIGRLDLNAAGLLGTISASRRETHEGLIKLFKEVKDSTDILKNLLSTLTKLNLDNEQKLRTLTINIEKRRKGSYSGWSGAMIDNFTPANPKETMDFLKVLRDYYGNPEMPSVMAQVAKRINPTNEVLIPVVEAALKTEPSWARYAYLVQVIYFFDVLTPTQRNQIAAHLEYETRLKRTWPNELIDTVTKLAPEVGANWRQLLEQRTLAGENCPSTFDRLKGWFRK